MFSESSYSRRQDDGKDFFLAPTPTSAILKMDMTTIIIATGCENDAICQSSSSVALIVLRSTYLNATQDVGSNNAGIGNPLGLSCCLHSTAKYRRRGGGEGDYISNSRLLPTYCTCHRDAAMAGKFHGTVHELIADSFTMAGNEESGMEWEGHTFVVA